MSPTRGTIYTVGSRAANRDARRPWLRHAVVCRGDGGVLHREGQRRAEAGLVSKRPKTEEPADQKNSNRRQRDGADHETGA